MKSVAEYRKAVVAAVGSVVVLLNSGLHTFAAFVPASASTVVSTVVVFVTAVGVYLTENAETIDKL